MEKKHFKANAGQLITGIFMILFAVIVELAAISGSKGIEDRAILLIAGNVIMILPIAIGGLLFASVYFTDCKNIKKAKEKYGEDKIKAHISSNLQKEYSKKGRSVYFTDRVIVDFAQGVIPYNMIAFAHLTNVKTDYNTLTSISVKTLDEETFMICQKISVKEAEEYLLFLHEMNPEILLGYSEAKEEQYNALVEEYKAGKITVADVTL